MLSLYRLIVGVILLLLCYALPVSGQIGGIEGKLVYSRKGKIRVHLLGSSQYTELGRGKFARWGPDGQKVAVKHKSTVYVIDADGGNKKTLVTDAEGDKNCPLEFHPNGREVLFIRDKRIVAVDIETQKERVMVPFVSCTGEIGMATENNRVVCRDGHELRAIDIDTKRNTIYHDDNCSAGISPDGNYVTMNDNGKPHHLSVFIRKINPTCTFTTEYLRISHDVMPGEIMGDNHTWSNHNDWITCEGDNWRNGVPYMINIATRKGYVMADVEDTKYPDLWVKASTEHKAASGR